MRVALITRATLHKVPGGDTVQIEQTAGHLRQMGVLVDIVPSGSRINYSQYDLFHFFNIIRPADLLDHTKKCAKPYVVTPILVDYSEYDRHHRKGISGFILRRFSPSANEYIKTIGRWLMGKDQLVSKSYLLKGQQLSIRQVLAKASWLLPNSLAEYHDLEVKFGTTTPYTIVPNGIDTSLFTPNSSVSRDPHLVICVARIEGIKNQLHLIRALNNTEFTLMLIGSTAPNQHNYYTECRKLAAENIAFHHHLPHAALLQYYQKATTHVLPSWFETCGLSSLEAAASGCAVVISDRGYARDYFGQDAFYCDPDDPASILDAIRKAAASKKDGQLSKRITAAYTWEKAATITLDVYQKILSH